MGLLNGKVAIITGANSGVGAAAAKIFAEQGACVAIGARRVEPLEAVAEEIRAAGGEVICCALDISQADQAKAIVDAAMEKWDHIDALINNAGVSDNSFAGVATTDMAEVERLLAINTMGTMNMIQAAIPHMGEGASIVNIASIAGTKGTAGAAYCASKGAILAVTKNVAMCYADAKIRCNAICPGGILTPMMTEIDYAAVDMTVMGAIGKHTDTEMTPSTPEDVANVALALASDLTRPITGQIIVSDFGASL